jgi:preprotein translocase subunit YajC
MFSLISDAHAQAAGAATQGSPEFLSLSNPLFMIVIMIVLMYFLVMRPQQKRAKEHQALLSALTKGDEVITQGGIAGKVASVGDNFVKIEVSTGVEISMQKSAIISVLPKGTL